MDIDPAMFAGLAIGIVFFVIWLIIVNDSFLDSLDLLILCLLGSNFSIIYGYWVSDLVDLKILDWLKNVGIFELHECLIRIILGVISILIVIDLQGEGAFHETLIFESDPLWSGTNDNISIVTGTNQKGAEND